MSKVYVYLAGPVSGATSQEATGWREGVQGALRRIHPDIIGVSPVRYEPIMDGETHLRVGEYNQELCNQIVAKNRLDVKRCDLLLAYLPSLSTGTLQEIGWAYGMEKPIIVVSPLASVLYHPVIMGSVPWRFGEPGGFKEALKVIRGLFEEYAR